ncbi:BZ3500_MvSof-1268-A1-R1_Chr8-1g09993 [Microbotryum saponariae]|uniref:BZ3500_MvSof-1268-A1-R1_Chr8-1g09993 protein n=1 Tax=Microbotryum saponariae TaxID=289078 RepID=A0A2X0LQQ6_9BASI|nr:BZ3500_MvSof-1268-A1-R1_Chr8-1g09993 [Microbotryum saponariae]SDA08279.1 BZ3501_MvSof-1269-A2-R1_Chr8-1g09716 [Microbotryum saponariae]
MPSTQSTSAQTTLTSTTTPNKGALGSIGLRGSYEPLVAKSLLDGYKSSDVTPVIGREYPDLQLSELLKAPNADELIRDLAIVISQRGVAFFKNQSLTIHEQKELGNKLGALSGRPSASGLHIHPTERSAELPNDVSTIYSQRQAYHKHRTALGRLASRGWHSDITFEPIPSDFAILKIKTLPETGGDTLWASAYEAYDRLSPAYKKFVEGLTAEHEGNGFHQVAAAQGTKVYSEVRGNPANVGNDLRAIHPVVRTNPITGWKGLFINQGFTKRIVELTKDESDETLAYLFKLYNQNHDLQVRYRWSKNDVAIWANGPTVHTVPTIPTATYDYDDTREGDRVVSLGEKPYYDSQSVSRREALGIESFV